MKATIPRVFEITSHLASKVSGILLFAFLLFVFTGPVYTQQLITERIDEKELKEDFDDFISRLDSLSLTRKYPEIAKKIVSSQSEQQTVALRMLGESQEIIAIPWIILFLDSKDQYVRVSAGLAAKQVVSSIALRRRHSRFHRYTILKRLGKRDSDLTPVAWLALRLMRSEDPSLISYGITMARYLNLYEFEYEILKHKESVHPAVTNTVIWAIEELRLQKKYDAGELQPNK